jgi:hypothetical protein
MLDAGAAQMDRAVFSFKTPLDKSESSDTIQSKIQ